MMYSASEDQWATVSCEDAHYNKAFPPITLFPNNRWCTMELQGRLAHFPLPELIALCADSLITGTLTIATPQGKHVLYFDEGQVHHVHASHAVNWAAFWPLFNLPDATFHFRAGSPHDPWLRRPKITEATASLLTRAQDCAARWRLLQKDFASPQIVPRLAVGLPKQQVRINRADWPVLAAIDGQNTIADLAQLLVLDEITVGESLLRLRGRGLVCWEVSQPVLATIKRGA